MRNTCLLPALILVVLSGCRGADGQAGSTERNAGREGRIMRVPALVGDRSTPDLAVKSYWRFHALRDSIEWSLVDSASWEFSQYQEFEAARKSFHAGPALEDIQREQARQTYSREILEVQQQSPSRAAVLVRVRNTTPIPPGAVATEYDQKRRQEGDLYRFVLDRDSTAWKIVQVQDWEAYRDAWRDRFGTGPHVPTWTQPY